MIKYASLLLFSLFFLSCSAPIQGTASFTLLTDQDAKIAKNYKVIGEPVKEKMCLSYGPLFLISFGKHPIHEALLDDMQRTYKADAFVNSTFKTSSIMIPYIFMQNCVSIEGTPVVLKGDK